MGMSAYEVVRRAVEFDFPDRLPVRFNVLGSSDVHLAAWNQIGTGDKDQHETLDEWGCLWKRNEMSNMGQVKGHPLENWSALEHFRWPDPDDPAFYDGMDEHFVGSDGKYVVTEIFMLLFERMQALRGFENTLSDLYLEKEKIELLADRIVEYNLRLIENISRRYGSQIHGLGFTDDWGTQQSVIINPRMWRDFFAPRYRRIFDEIHAAGWHVWMHSCGKVNGILDQLIDAGVNVMNLQQPRALGIKEIGAQFRGKVCFESLCDIQRTLPFGDVEAIQAEAELLLAEWATPAGGFVLSDYGDGRAIGVPLEKKQIMLEAFLRADRWKKK